MALPFLAKKEEVSTDPKPELTFKLENSKITPLPDISDPKKINVRYPLLAPYAYVHIYWDKKVNELVYYLEEKKLCDF